MSRSRHPHERGTELAYQRWRRRNIDYKKQRPSDVRRAPSTSEAEADDNLAYGRVIAARRRGLLAHLDAKVWWMGASPSQRRR